MHYPFQLLAFSGFLATFVMSVMVFPLFSDHLPSLELGTILFSDLAGPGVAPHSTWWWIGIAEHFVVGTVLFPMLYSVTLARLMPNRPLLGGILWGTGVWLVAQALLAPIFGFGFFGKAVWDASVYGPLTLFPHFIYGVVFGVALGYPLRRSNRVATTPLKESRAA